MNKLLVVIFDNDTAANAGLTALRQLHAAGDISLYADGVVARDANGDLSVRKPMDGADAAASGTVTGLAVGSLIGLLGGPVGLAIGAVTGTVAGAVRDFWVAGVGLDFIEEAARHLLALVADIEEEWVTPVDLALEAAGGQVFRRARSEVAEAQFDHDITAFRAEIKALESEATQASGSAKTRLQAKLVQAKANLAGAVQRAQWQADQLKQEAVARTAALKQQMGQAKADVKARIDDRIQRLKHAYHARGAKLSQAWHLTKDALTA